MNRPSSARQACAAPAPSLTSALLLFSLAFACQNSGGTILGPSGVAGEYLGPTCQIPCKTLDDCNKIKPLYITAYFGNKPYPETDIADLPYVWLECKDGSCVDVECRDDDGCEFHRIEGKDGSACVKNQCAPDCKYSVDCPGTFRDECIEGKCLRLEPEKPDPGCKGDKCQCFSDDDCPGWAHCRWDNVCARVLSDVSTSAQGRRCDSDHACAVYYVHQAMLAEGMNIAIQYSFSGGTCGIVCGDDEQTQCGAGFTCVDVKDVGSEYSNDYTDNHTERSVCVPNECTDDAGCSPSYEECNADEDCPGGETCTWPWTGCPGVCLDLECKSCSSWID
ncbi:MAG: hypothetical protein HY897_22200, partial [Deltaproteobacteria bacterium]|nr:hypothetical protein [Deltaproteobacteria bacterium]